MGNMLAEAIGYGNRGYLSGQLTANSHIASQAFDEDPAALAKYRAQKEQEEKEYRRKNTAMAIVSIAERLAVEHGDCFTPEIAFKVAVDLYNRGKEFMDTFTIEDKSS